MAAGEDGGEKQEDEWEEERYRSEVSEEATRDPEDSLLGTLH